MMMYLSGKTEQCQFNFFLVAVKGMNGLAVFGRDFREFTRDFQRVVMKGILIC